MIDRDLAELYEVPTFVLNQAVKRNQERFPEGFMFRLSRPEARGLITNCDRFRSLKHSVVTPLAFTEYGVAMLSSVLKSRRAIRMNVQIIQTFIRLRQWALSHKDLALKIKSLERKARHHDYRIREIFHEIRKLAEPPRKPKPKIGFKPQTE